MDGLRSPARGFHPHIEIDNASSEHPSSILAGLGDRRPSGNHLLPPDRRAAPEVLGPGGQRVRGRGAWTTESTLD